MRRASKRLINAIIALVASVILCIGMCLAWFAMNTDVSGNGLQTQVKGSDIVDFNVTAYYLDYNDDKSGLVLADTGNVESLAKTFDNKTNGTLGKLDTFADSPNDEMRSYDSSKAYSSAVLFEVNYKLDEGADSNKKFRIYATCPTAIDGYMSENVFNVLSAGNDNYNSSLSNCVSIYEATETSNVYTCGTGKTFIADDKTKTFKQVLTENITVSGGTDVTVRYIMDYNSTLFDALSSKMLTLGGTLNSKLSLYGDIIFGIEEYDSTATAPTVTAVTFVNSTSKTSQAVGSDTMSSTWEFLITYSDDTYKTVKYNAEDFTITGLDTSTTTDSGTATVEYGGINVVIPYKITDGIAVTGISLDTTTKTITAEETFTLTATVTPDDAANKTVKWESSNTSVATVSSTGKVTAVAVGTATITAKCEANQSIYATCTVTVKAKTYTVTFNMNGHGTNTEVKVNDGGTVEKPTNPTATGYEFGGWYKEAECTNEFNFNTETISSDTTIYAKWTLTPYTITYAAVDGISGTNSNPTSYTIETDTITLVEVSKDGYTFNGWYNGETKVTEIPKGSTGDLILAAKWTKNSGSGGETGSPVTITADNCGVSAGSKFTSATNDLFTLEDTSASTTYTVTELLAAGGGTSATANDSSSLTFSNAFLPGGATSSMTITAKKAISVTVYYTVSDSSFNSKSQTKGGFLKWTINGGTAVSDSNTNGKDGRTAYAVKISLSEGDVLVLTSSSNRLVIFGVVAEEVTSSS